MAQTAVKPPPGIARIDWNKPISRGLKFCCACNEKGERERDLVTGNLSNGDIGGQLSRESHTSGDVLAFTSSNTSDFQQFAHDERWDFTGENGLTIVARTWDNGAANGYVIGKVQSAWKFTLDIGSEAFRMGINQAFSVSWPGGAGGLDDYEDRWTVWGGTWDGSDATTPKARIYVDGYERNTATRDVTLNTNNDPLAVGDRGNNSSALEDCKIDIVSVWARVFTPSEWRFIEANPYDHITQLDYDEYFMLLLVNVAGGSALLKIIAETVAASEASARPRVMRREIAETEAATETSARPRVMLRAIAETQAISEAVTRVKAMFRAIAETEAVTETNARVLGFVRVVDETLGISEAITRLREYLRAIDETEALTETNSRPRVLSRAIDETEAATETSARPRVMLRAIAETQAISEAVTRVKAMFRAIAETEAVTETNAKVLGFVRVVDETLGITEAINKVRGYIRAISETEALTETSSRPRVLSRAIDETEAATETSARPRVMLRAIAETQAISETIARVKAMLKIIDETAAITESIVKSTGAVVIGAINWVIIKTQPLIALTVSIKDRLKMTIKAK